MSKSNIDVSGRLIYDQLGYIYDFAVNQGTVTKIHIKSDDENADLRATQNGNFAKVHNVGTLTKVKAQLTLPK